MGLDLQEKERRYRLIRENMADKRLDALIVISDAQINHKGFVKYLTNYRSILYNLVVILPLKGDARLLVPSPVQKYWAELLSWIGTIEEQIPNLTETLKRNLAEMGLFAATIGLVNDRIMPAGTYNALTHSFPELSLVDATSMIEELRMRKADAELEAVKAAAALADLSFRTLSENLKEGMTERELIGLIDGKLIAEGAEDIFHLFSSRPGNLFPYAPSDRAMQKGDVIILNTEVSGPGGYWVQMIRTVFYGKPKRQVEEMYDILIRIRSALTSELRPNRKASEVAAWVRKEIMGAGFEVGVNFGHCLGLDVVERPLIHLNEEALLQPGMVLTVHPQLVSIDKDATIWLGDTYLITETGSELLTKVEPAEVERIEWGALC
jgi:Xaa-Pro aminopeptidase